MMNSCGVYILRSLKNGRYYIGSSNNIERRLGEHNNGKVKSTRFITPFELKAAIYCKSLEEARASEYRLKQYKNKAIIEKVISDRVFPWNHMGT